MEWPEAFNALQRALDRLKEVLGEPETDLTRDAAIKRFEFTFELAWKATQRFLREQGILCRSPRDCFREAFSFGLVQDSPLWIRMMEDRNPTVQTYSEQTARRIYGNLGDYVPLYEELLSGLSGQLEPK